MEITYVTGNQFKVLVATKYLKPLGIKVINNDLDIPEIQADSIEEISIHSATEASKVLNKDVLVNDSGLIVPSLNNFPGPYSKYAEQTLKEDGLLKLMKDITNREAYFIEVLTYKKVNEEPIVIISKTLGSIAKEPKGSFGWSFDKIFIPKGETKTLAQFPEEERYKFFTNEGYISLAKILKDN